MYKELPSLIFRMVGTLHERGFTDVYLYSGMSPSSMNWRFEIGLLHHGSWPNRFLVDGFLIEGSVRSEGVVAWSKHGSTIQNLTDDFEKFYRLTKPSENRLNLEYVRWFSGLLSILKGEEAPIYYADYEGPHEYLLKSAPGYKDMNRS